MGVYNHFDSKFGIVEALFIQGFERLGEAMATIAEIDDPYEALREAGRRYRGPGSGPPDGVPGDVPAGRPRVRAERPTRSRSPPGAFDSLVAAVRRAMAAGSSPTVLPRRDRPADLGRHPRLGLPRTARHRIRRGPGRWIRPRLCSRCCGASARSPGSRGSGARGYLGSGRSRFQWRATVGYHFVTSPSRRGIMPNLVMVRCPPSWSP